MLQVKMLQLLACALKAALADRQYWALSTMVCTEVMARSKNTTGGRIQGMKILIKHHVCWHGSETSHNPTKSVHSDFT